MQCRYEHITEKNFIFRSADVLNGQNSLEPWHLFKSHYESQGVEVTTLDLVEDPDSIDVAIFLDRPRSRTPTIDRILVDQQIFKILILFESPPIAPDNWDMEYHKHFNHVFTWADDLVDGRFYIKSNFHGMEVCRNDFGKLTLNHEDRKLACMINSCVIPTEVYPKNELYTSRISFIRYMEKLHPADFDLFGNNWPSEHFTSYRGRSTNKYATYANYKFCFCFENFFGYNGYVSEKILDCLASGIVPVYLGAPNISRWIPKSCFIDFREFGSFDSLLVALKKISKAEYSEMLGGIKAFWTDLSRNYFTTTNFLNTLYEYIDWNKTIDNQMGCLVFPGVSADFRRGRELFQHKDSPRHLTPLPKEKNPEPSLCRIALPAKELRDRCSPLLLIGWDANQQMYRDCKLAWEFLLDRNPWLNVLFVDWNDSLDRGSYFFGEKSLSIGCKPLVSSDDQSSYYDTGVWSAPENERTVYRTAKTYEIALKRFPSARHLWFSTITSIVSPGWIRVLSGLLPHHGLYAGYPGTLREGLYKGIQMIHGATPILSRDVAQKIVERFQDGSPDNQIPNDHWQGIMLQDVPRTPLPLFVFERPRPDPTDLHEVYGITEQMLQLGFHHFRVKTKNNKNKSYDRTGVDPRILIRIAEAMDDCRNFTAESAVRLQNHFVDCCTSDSLIKRSIPFNDLEI